MRSAERSHWNEGMGARAWARGHGDEVIGTRLSGLGHGNEYGEKGMETKGDYGMGSEGKNNVAGLRSNRHPPGSTL